MFVALVKRTTSICSCTRLCEDRFEKLSDIDGFNVADVNSKELDPVLLFGDHRLDIVVNRIILEATIFCIKALAKLN